MNAVKHGMTARIPVLPGEDEETFRQRVEGIVDSLSPRNALEVALAEQAALSLWKIERAERVEAARAAATLRAAEAQADAQQQEELAAMGRWLLANTVKTKREAAEDLLPFLPEDRHAPFRAGRGEPLVIFLRIQATADGCRWLLDRWDRLRASLEQNGCWDVEEMITAAQLQGQRPLFMETAEWECLVQERNVAHNPALMEEGRLQLLDQLTEGQADDPAGPAAELLELVEQETARLEELQEARQEREAVDRSELADRLAVDATPEGERVRRYELDCDRKLHRAIHSLLKLRREEGLAADPDVQGVDAPAGPVEPANVLTPTLTDVPVTVLISSGAVEPLDRLAPMGTDVPVTASGLVERESGLMPMATDLPAIATATAGAIEPEDGGDGAQGAISEHPAPPAVAAPDREPVGSNEPASPFGGEPGPQNEPDPAVGGDEEPPSEPGGLGWIAALSVPVLAFALVLLLAARLSSAIVGPIGQPDVTALVGRAVQQGIRISLG
jgi:hypothetical protein